ncbi:uncharacterized protein YALI1_D02611g [Yarrowia lipolytica]|uniref:Uncharacterized protein n=1 Tax=Yarrowia lipolytica TaxID=4952 RepID=A0A1D8NCW5_YARLL|nr:hypothetical protein YALI1_D02611g [Yarrowia lipolytica]
MDNTEWVPRETRGATTHKDTTRIRRLIRHNYLPWLLPGLQSPPKLLHQPLVRLFRHIGKCLASCIAATTCPLKVSAKHRCKYVLTGPRNSPKHQTWTARGLVA